MRVKEHNPAAKFGDISRSVAAMWEGMDETEKLIFRYHHHQLTLTHSRI
jgi:hypothetical protein